MVTLQWSSVVCRLEPAYTEGAASDAGARSQAAFSWTLRCIGVVLDPASTACRHVSNALMTGAAEASCPPGVGGHCTPLHVDVHVHMSHATSCAPDARPF
ncbi:hypothetical protein CHLRE_14g612426v5 [Chlamydomonas reinhardtii]|uniref:Uncharacterized protein n=1 Tax=Chlamydomonas reinhardtii TaxID=3055 RepID=A0A2K3CXG0_CHLRE|nr:uncharacterized protein CHLRE_14g612426v5 [Chlamydomonas reinhardtii]PNW72939.1 hypothetical protein CHLRE_14g612426v5 [Chlamydomonas reinhardtii]